MKIGQNAFKVFYPLTPQNTKVQTENFIEELRWCGMLVQMMPGTEETLQRETVSAYSGIDPAADSLHIGHLCGIMMLCHLQRYGYKPYFLVGGATDMIGDSSGKGQERNLLDTETLYHDQEAIKKQVSKFPDFDGNGSNKAEMVNNYDWMRDFTFLGFARLVSRHITVDYMMVKDSMKKRLSGGSHDGLSFTEFAYQLLQGCDLLYLFEKLGVKLQLGGNDQQGNMTTGIELIRRTLGNETETYCLTCPLTTKADGKELGKTESGNIWLNCSRITPYAFYQFQLNVSDDDAERYIKIFASLGKDVIDNSTEEHRQDPGRRILQYHLAEEVIRMIHSQKDLDMTIVTSNILFGKGTKENLLQLDEQTLTDVFKDVPYCEVSKNVPGQPAVDVFNQGGMQIFPSKSEMCKLVKGGGVTLNKEKPATLDQPVIVEDLIDGKYLLIQKGKRDYSLIIVK